jgi:hypothetical protein
LFRKVLESSNGSLSQDLKSEIEQQIDLLTKETNELHLLESLKQQQQQQSTTEESAPCLPASNGNLILPSEENNNNNNEENSDFLSVASPNGENGNGENRENGGKPEEYNLTSEDMKEAQAEVSEDVYSVYV